MQSVVDNISESRRILAERGICVIIPTYNNAGTIADVVTRTMALCSDVIVVCDGCTDGTVDILHSLSPAPEIVEIPDNKGKGFALKTGFLRALAAGFAYAITLDGDGQHFPEDIPLLLQANIDNPGALVVGARSNLENVQRSRGSRFANSFSNFWFAVQTGRYLKDTQTGYRLYPLKKLPCLGLLTSRYEAELELLVLSAWKGVRTESVPVNVFYPPAGEKVSHFRPVIDFIRISILNVVLCVAALVAGYPLALLRMVAALLRSLVSLVVFSVFTVFFFTPAMLIYFTIGGMSEKKRENLHGMICSVARFTLLRLGIPGIRYTLANNSGETFEKPAVIICNHQSHLDLVPMLALTPKLIVLTNDWVWNDPFYGYIIHRAEFLPVSKGIDYILPRLQEKVLRGYSIAVYPEGTRSKDCRIGRFHSGAFHLADALNLDIVPVVLYGAGRALPKHGRYLRRWPVHLEVDSRISPEEQSRMGDTFRQRASAMKKYYVERYGAIANRMDQDV